MDDDDEYGTHKVQRPSRALRWQNVMAVVLSGTSAAIEQVGDTLEALAHILMSAGNYADDREQFREQAALELETILEEDE